MFARVAAIVILGAMTYGAMLPAPFRVMDDRISIVENPVIKSFANIPQIFQKSFFEGQAYYRPLVTLSFMGEYHAFGLNSFFFNLDNLILHILNALLVFFLVTRLAHSETVGFWTGILFVVHPVQWEAVCNIPGRAILLSAFFGLSAFLLFLKFYKQHQGIYLLGVLAAFLLALLSKESAGVLPVVVLAYLAMDRERPWREKGIFIWPFAVAIAGYLLLRIYFGITNVHPANTAAGVLLGFVTFLRSLITDLRLFVFPVDLHYDRSLAFITSMAQPMAWGSCLFWAAVLAGLCLFRRSIRPIFLFWSAWFLIELFPVSQLVVSIGVGAGHISTAEHFLYLAAVPALAALVMGFQWVYELNNRRRFIKASFLKFLAGGFLLFLFLTAVEQSIYASNEFNMVSRSLSYEPDNPRVEGEMGMLSVFRKDFQSAEKFFRAAIKAEPLNPTYHVFLGTTLCQQGRWIEGLEQLVALEPLPKDKPLVERQERLAIRQIQAELAQGHDYDWQGWLAIGIYYAKIGDGLHATEAFAKSTDLNPDQPDAWFNLGSLYEAQRNWPLAAESYNRLLGLAGATAFQRRIASRHLAKIEGNSR